MISLRRLTLLFGAALTLASTAFAQSGTITVTGTNPESFSLTNTAGGVLSSTITLAPMTPANSNTAVEGEAEVRLRSNKAYKLNVQAGALSVNIPGSDDGGDAIALADIGFGVKGTVLTGANVANSGSRGETMTAGYTVASWPTASNGLTPAFGKTLNDITSSTQVLTGTRISKKGNLATDNNFISITFGVATLPQFHTPNSGFSSIITVTMASQ
jgi:hypothetical protein